MINPNHHPDQLAAKIAAQNDANATANRIAAELQPYLAPFVGRKIYLASGGKADKFKKALPDYNANGNNFRPQIWIQEAHGFLRLTVKTCHTYPSRRPDCQFATYAEQWTHLGRITDDGKLAELAPIEQFRTDWTAGEIISARAALDKAKRAVDEARRAIGNFGEYDQ